MDDPILQLLRSWIGVQFRDRNYDQFRQLIDTAGLSNGRFCEYMDAAIELDDAEALITLFHKARTVDADDFFDFSENFDIIPISKCSMYDNNPLNRYFVKLLQSFDSSDEIKLVVIYLIDMQFESMGLMDALFYKYFAQGIISEKTTVHLTRMFNNPMYLNYVNMLDEMDPAEIALVFDMAKNNNIRVLSTVGRSFQNRLTALPSLFTNETMYHSMNNNNPFFLRRFFLMLKNNRYQITMDMRPLLFDTEYQFKDVMTLEYAHAAFTKNRIEPLEDVDVPLTPYQLQQNLLSFQQYLDEFPGLPSELIQPQYNNIWSTILSSFPQAEDIRDEIRNNSVLITNVEEYMNFIAMVRETDTIGDEEDTDSEPEETEDDDEFLAAQQQQRHEAYAPIPRRIPRDESDELYDLVVEGANENYKEEIADFIAQLRDEHLEDITKTVMNNLTFQEKTFFSKILKDVSLTNERCKNRLELVLQTSMANVDDSISIKYAGQGDKAMCYSKQAIRMSVENEGTEMRYWVRKGKDPIEDEGFGGEPGPKETRVFKMSDGNWLLFFSMRPILDPNNDQTHFYTKIVSVGQRVGNVNGQFGVSQQHGQAPGETIHALISVRTVRRRLF